jgi:hypothetical protein
MSAKPPNNMIDVTNFARNAGVEVGRPIPKPNNTRLVDISGKGVTVQLLVNEQNRLPYRELMKAVRGTPLASVAQAYAV